MSKLFIPPTITLVDRHIIGSQSCEEKEKEKHMKD